MSASSDGPSEMSAAQASPAVDEREEPRNRIDRKSGAPNFSPLPSARPVGRGSALPALRCRPAVHGGVPSIPSRGSSHRRGDIGGQERGVAGEVRPPIPWGSEGPDIGCLFKYMYPAMTPREELKHIDFDCIDDIRSRLFGQEENHPLNDVDSDVEKQTLVDFSFRVGIQIFTRTRTRD